MNRNTNSNIFIKGLHLFVIAFLLVVAFGIMPVLSTQAATLQWNTFMGSSSFDEGYAIAVDGSGNVYVVGVSISTWGTPVNAPSGGYDAFAAKLDSSGSLQWNTFMGSSSNDEGFAVAVDGGGNVYVAGYSYATWGSPVNAFTGSNDAFVAKLDSSGSLQWNTFMGSSIEDIGYAVAVDGSGDVYVAGFSLATWGTPVNAFAGLADTFAAKLDSSGSLQWSTFMGSSIEDYGRAITVDGSGNVYVAGQSHDTWGIPVNAYTGDWDAFAVKLDSSGSLQWNTFMGSSSYDYGYAIAVDVSGNVYVAGHSTVTWGLPVNAHTENNYDAFAAKLDNSGSLLWNTFIGSSNHDYGRAIALDGSGNVYVAGENYASPGNYNAFATKLDTSGSLQWNRFMGSSIEDYGNGIAVDGNGNVYVAGSSDAKWGKPLNAHAGGRDAFAAKIIPGSDSNSSGCFIATAAR